MPSLRDIASATLAVTVLAPALGTGPHTGHLHATNSSNWDFFTGFGSYMPRTHCIVNAEGNADWPWIIALITLTLGIIVAYLRIYYFWMKTHHEQESRDRNKKMFELANIFFWCAICGYAFSVVAFAWPAYRLLAAALLLLNIWSWKFVLTDLGEFKQSLCSKAIEREFREQLEERNRTLEHDVKERTRELEIARHRAEDANLAKSQFLAAMSHEIRTPMTAILGYAEILADDTLKHDCPKHLREAVDTIHTSSQHLLMIIDDILDVSKIEAGRMTVEKIPVDPIELVESTRSLQEGRASAKSIDIVTIYTTPIPRQIMSDPTRLRQILLNIIGNAIKFTDTGRISIRVAFDQECSSLRFAIEDTGAGIPPNQLDLLRTFQAFNQADSTTTRKHGGTGLGLKISAELARLLGGSLTIDSEAGQGTTVSVEIATGDITSEELIEPADIFTYTTSTTGHASTWSQTRQNRLQGVSVLLAEDGADNQKLISFLLKSEGASVTIAANGQEALDIVEKCGHAAFDAVLMDMQMPVLDGYESTKQLRIRGFTGPIVALTAHAMADAKTRCLNAGCSEYLTKPIDRQTLISTIASCVATGRRRSAA